MTNIKVLATITTKSGKKSTQTFTIPTAKRGLFKEEIERRILTSFGNHITKVRVH